VYVNACASTEDDSNKVASTDARVTTFIMVTIRWWIDGCEEGEWRGIDVDSDRSIHDSPETIYRLASDRVEACRVETKDAPPIDVF